VADELEPRIAEQAQDIVLGSREQIVDAQDLVALRDQPVAQVRAQKTGTPGDQDPLRRPFPFQFRIRICLQVGRAPAAWSGYNFGDVRRGSTRWGSSSGDPLEDNNSTG
jgi:hypothetical protein